MPPRQHTSYSQRGVRDDTTSTQQSGFFDLSAELRNLIYQEVIERQDEIWLTASRKYRLEDGTSAPVALTPAVSNVCRMMRAETLPMYFGNATLSITLMREANVARAKSWAAAIGDDAINSIKYLRLQGPRSQRNHTFYGFPTIRLRLEKQRHGSVHIVEGCHEVSCAIKLEAATIDRMEACIANTPAGCMPLSRREDLEALVETFASLLYFREDPCDVKRNHMNARVDTKTGLLATDD